LRKLFYLSILLLFANAAPAAGGACPTGANYYNAAGSSLVTLGNLGITNCYYIAASGSDSNSGTSESSPWAHLPGMLTCTSNCAALTPAAGTGFILRGGDTWGNANLGIVWNWGGTSSNPIYIGVDLTWYSGSSWTRPIFSCGGSTCAGGNNNNFIYIFKPYVMLDNIEMTGLYESATNSPTFIKWTSNNVTISRNYLHGWSHAPTGANATAGIQGNASGGGAGTSGSVVAYNVCDGSDTSQDMMACIGGTVPNVWGNYIHLVETAIDGTGDNWHDNMVDTLVNCYVSGGCHQDGIYNTCAAYSSSILLYNNVVRNTTFPGSGGAVKFWLAGNCPFSGTGYMFNNIIYNNLTGNVINTGGHRAVPYGTWYIFNNTTACGTDSAPGACILGDNGNTGGSMTLTLSNNHWISTSKSQFSCTKTYVCTESNAVAQTAGRAKSQGYTSKSAYAFQPTKASGSTVGTGANLSSLCTAIGAIDANAGVACGNAASYACSYNSTNHTVICPALTPLSRGSTWDKGAYEYNGTPTVATPTFSPTAGTYTSSQSVTISVASPNASAVLYCQDTTNTCTPATSYSSAVSVTGTGYLRAYATHSGFNNSGIASGQYQIGSSAPGNVVQHTAARCASGTTCAVALVNSVTAGDYILAAGWDATGKNLSVTFSDGTNIYNQVTFDGNVYCNLDTDLNTLGVSYAVASSSGPVTVTMADDANNIGIRIVEIAEVSGLTGLDKTACANPTGTSISSGNTATTGQANEFLFGFMGNNANNILTLSAGSGYKGMDVVANGLSGYNCVYDEYQSVTSTGAYAATFSQSVSEEAAVVIATFSIGGGPAVSLTPTSATFTISQNTTSANQTSTLQNGGNADLTVTADGTLGISRKRNLEPVL
jgi:hypothetical protein